MWRYFTAKGTRNFLGVLQDFLEGYNNKIHRSIGMAPKDVSFKNQEAVWQKLYGTNERIIPPTYQVGDLVRLSMATRPFRKSYLHTMDGGNIHCEQSHSPKTTRVWCSRL